MVNLLQKKPLDDPRLEKGQKGEASGGVLGHLRFGKAQLVELPFGKLT